MHNRHPPSPRTPCVALKTPTVINLMYHIQLSLQLKQISAPWETFPLTHRWHNPPNPPQQILKLQN